MDNGYYMLPLDLRSIILKKDVPRCSLMHSVAQNIHLILTSKFGENRDDPTYGCSIWDEEFDVLPNLNSWKDRLGNSIRVSLQEHEKRILNARVSVQIVQDEMGDSILKAFRIKRRVDITITGNLAKTNEPCTFYDNFYIGPISFD